MDDERYVVFWSEGGQTRFRAFALYDEAVKFYHRVRTKDGKKMVDAQTGRWIYFDGV